MITYASLKTHPSRLLSLTSLSVAEFEALIPTFQNEYAKRISPTHTATGKPRHRKLGGGNKPRLATPEDRLLFILVYQKTYPLQTVLGTQFGLSQAQANEWIHRLMPVLEQTLVALKQMPERNGMAFATRQNAATLPPDYFIDGTERRRQRPKNAKKQCETYSGKKNAHRQECDPR